MQDYTDDLAAVENSLRRIIERIGNDAHGTTWLSVFAKPNRIKQWESRRDGELAKRSNGIQEQRPLYFSDFSDLIQIVTDNWALFEPVFGDQSQTIVYLEKLRELRNPDAHRRELTQGEKSLIVGMASELRTKITRYMATKDTPDEYFPRIETIRDNIGTIKDYSNLLAYKKRPVVRVGDIIEFVIEAWDPEGKAVEFQWGIEPYKKFVVQDWSNSNRFTWHVQETQIANPARIHIWMRSSRKHHAKGEYDDSSIMEYTVLPSI